MLDLNFLIAKIEFKLDINKDLWNNGHFNIYGAEKITSVVAEYFVLEYGLVDKRKNKKYSQWNEELIEWNNEVVEQKQNIDSLVEENEQTE